MKKIYLDNAATTPQREEVTRAMLPYFADIFGNASSVHNFGQEASQGVEKARQQAAGFLNCQPQEIIFTSGATEGNNAVVKSVARKLKKEKGKTHIITTQIEHDCVLVSAGNLEKEGFEVTLLPIDQNGQVSAADLEKSITDKTALISIMYANNEIGSIQPIKELAQIAKDRGVLFHTDAVQAANYLDCDVRKLGVDYLTLSAHKFYGPKGVGLIYKKKDAPFVPYLTGGAQENRQRAGTLNTPGIVGLGKALELTSLEKDKRISHTKNLRDELWKGLKKEIPEIMLNGSLENRLPNNLNITVKYVEGESMLLSLDMEGIAISTGSACSSGSLKPSHVILALGTPKEFSHGSLRFTFGQQNTKKDVNHVINVLPDIIKRLRKMSAVAPKEYK